MINILKQGKIIKKTKLIYKVKCHICECEFECELDDFIYLTRGLVPQLGRINCPCCSNKLDIVINNLEFREEEVSEEDSIHIKYND